MRFEAIALPELHDDERPLGIRIDADSEERRLVISDNGIGMTRADLVENLGTIAKSGTKEFAQKMSGDDKQSDVEALIGQFGVGFYSAFMAASHIEVVSDTRKSLIVGHRPETVHSPSNGRRDARVQRYA